MEPSFIILEISNTFEFLSVSYRLILSQDRKVQTKRPKIADSIKIDAASIPHLLSSLLRKYQHFSIFSSIISKVKVTFEFFEKIDSTQLEAERVLKKEPYKGYKLILANEQTAGIGTIKDGKNKKWISPPGNLYATFMLMPKKKIEHYSIAAAIFMIQAIYKTTGIKTFLKEPNDLIFQGGKCGGILGSWHEDNEGKEILCIGAGVNCSYAPETDQKTTFFKCDPKKLAFQWVKEFLNENI